VTESTIAIWVPHRRSDELLRFLSSWVLRKVCYVQIWHTHFFATPTASALFSFSLMVALIARRDSNHFMPAPKQSRASVRRSKSRRRTRGRFRGVLLPRKYQRFGKLQLPQRASVGDNRIYRDGAPPASREGRDASRLFLSIEFTSSWICRCARTV